MPHQMLVEVSDNFTHFTFIFTCDEAEGAPCRMVCAIKGCEGWCDHNEQVDNGSCVMKDWFDNDGPVEVEGSTDVQFDIDPFWTDSGVGIKILNGTWKGQK